MMTWSATDWRNAAASGWRRRWLVVAGSCALLLSAWGYSRGEDQGLLMATAMMAAVAVALPRSLPTSQRWVVWMWLLFTVVCLAANVARLTPPQDAPGETRFMDRLVTFFFAVGVTALFFRPCALGVTVVALGGLPMIMLTLGRSEQSLVDALPFESAMLVWGYAALVLVHDGLERALQARSGDRAMIWSWREWLSRGVILAMVLAGAALLRPPIEQAVHAAQRHLFGLMLNLGRSGREQRGGDLNLARPVPSDFDERLRIIFLVHAEAMPGYLRERVFTTYQSGRWLAPKPGEPLAPSGDTAGATIGTSVAHTLTEACGSPITPWRVEMVAPRWLTAFVLPGNVQALRSAGTALLTDGSGMVVGEGGVPDRYEALVAKRPGGERAFPLPAPPPAGEHLGTPPALDHDVASWIAACPGLSEATTARAAAQALSRYFQTTFRYRLDVQLAHTPDPLVDFMRRREGSCAHFASAAALMLRARGFPARMVTGYVCGGWHPWLNRWVARERDGHAWIEVWDAGESRWLLSDPTPPDGRPSAWAHPGRARLAVDLLTTFWQRLLFRLRGASLLEAIAAAGGTLFLFVWHVIRSPAGLVVLSGFGLIAWLRRRWRRPAVAQEDGLRAELTAAMNRLAKRLTPEKCWRLESESWGLWARRIADSLPPERLAVVREWTESYQERRYRRRLDVAAARVWLARARRAARRGGKLFDCGSESDQA